MTLSAPSEVGALNAKNAKKRLARGEGDVVAAGLKKNIRHDLRKGLTPWASYKLEGYDCRVFVAVSRSAKLRPTA